MRQLLILSGKGGTGKTTVAGALIRLSQAHAFADCDVDAPNLHLLMDRKDQPERADFYGMMKADIDLYKCSRCGTCLQHCRFHAIEVASDGAYYVNIPACEGCGVCQAVCPDGVISMRDTVAGELMLYRDGTVFSTAKLRMGSGNSGKLVTEVKRQLQTVAADPDFAVIDGSPGIGCPVIASMSGVHTVLVVTEPSVSGISDLERILKTAAHFQVKALVCVNKYDLNPAYTDEIETYCRENGISFVGKIPFDKAVHQAVNMGKSAVDVDCAAGKAISEMYLAMKEHINGVFPDEK